MGFPIFCRLRIYLGQHHNPKDRASRVLSIRGLSSYLQISGGRGTALHCGDSTSSATDVLSEHKRDFSNATA